MQSFYQNSGVLILVAFILIATSTQSMAMVFDQINLQSATLTEHVADAEDCADHSDQEHAYHCCQMVLLIVDIKTDVLPTDLNELQLAARIPETNHELAEPPFRPPIA